MGKKCQTLATHIFSSHGAPNFTEHLGTRQDALYNMNWSSQDVPLHCGNISKSIKPDIFKELQIIQICKTSLFCQLGAVWVKQ